MNIITKQWGVISNAGKPVPPLPLQFYEPWEYLCSHIITLEHTESWEILCNVLDILQHTEVWES